jgi:uncharacterized coiled-coil DUF342 family protein
MENRTFKELIEELRELRIRETEIIAELKQAQEYRPETRTATGTKARHPSGTDSEDAAIACTSSTK